jgi:hypothetical protein
MMAIMQAARDHAWWPRERPRAFLVMAPDAPTQGDGTTEEHPYAAPALLTAN